MDIPQKLDYELRALNSLNSALDSLFKDAMQREEIALIIQRGIFNPAQDEEIAYWFARFTSLRNNLWDIVNTAIEHTGGTGEFSSIRDWQFFLIAYSAVCSLVRMDRFLITKVAYDPCVQRKLNEAFPQHRIERKQFTHIYKALFLPTNAIRIHDAHRTFKRNKHNIETAIANKTRLREVFNRIPKQERYLDLTWRRYLSAWFFSRRHAWRRRGASAKQKSLFTVLEYSGRFVAEIKLPRTKNVTREVREQLTSILEPGDFFITRHRQALTNLFLPGFWPHAALYVGPREQHDSTLESSEYLRYWQGDNHTLEAQKDGVRFRTLDETLSVDAFVVIRPNLPKAAITSAITKAVSHAGKGYNFDFDFFRSDQLVCTEVVYRAYDGANGYTIPLTERMGRKTLSAEDLLDLSLDSDWATPITIYGVGSSKKELVSGAALVPILENSYR